MRLALIVEYDGTQYHGFQYQVNAPTIQEEIEKAIEGLTGENIRIRGAGRTDAGVHAKGQVVAFDTSAYYSSIIVRDALNYYLPNDIAIDQAYEVDGRFDPRRDALSRIYRYTVLNQKTRSPLHERYAAFITDKLDIESMCVAADIMLGTHDFRMFSSPLKDKTASTIRRMDRLSLSQIDNVLTFDIEGSAFLPHQVRRMVGCLVDVGRQRLHLGNVRQLLNIDTNTTAVANTLDARGLCLIAVKYQNFPAGIGETNGIGR